MAMDLLPPEVLIIILAHCETLTSAYYFARANCRLYRIWLSCREQLAEPLARHEISLLDNALVIVRSLRWKLAILQAPWRRHQLTIERLDCSKTCWQDVIEVMNMHRVASLLEVRFQDSTLIQTFEGKQYTPSDVSPEWKVYSALNRLIEADMVVTGEYLAAMQDHKTHVALQPDPRRQHAYNMGSGDFQIDGERRRIAERFLLLLASCIFVDATELIYTEVPLLGPFGEQRWQKRPRDACRSLKQLSVMFSS